MNNKKSHCKIKSLTAKKMSHWKKNCLTVIENVSWQKKKPHGRKKSFKTKQGK